MKIQFLRNIALAAIFLQISAARASEKSISVMFWNVENLFDTVDEPGRMDEEFLPDGSANWTNEKLALKMQRLASVITDVQNPNGTSCPDILGMAEVENASVTQALNRGFLKICGYDKIIADPNDPDPRGIRVVTLTRLPVVTKPKSHSPYQGGRFIQEVQIALGERPLTFFVNHWKSKRASKPNQPSTENEGEEKRIASAKVLRARIEAILEENPEADIFSMGDFNDEPEHKSLSTALGSTLNFNRFADEYGKLLFWNPGAEIAKHPLLVDADPEDSEAQSNYRKLRATYYVNHLQRYTMIDNFHLSQGLFDQNGFEYEKNSHRVIRDKRYTDPYLRPIAYNQYNGYKGVSDHFPIFMRLKLHEE